MPTTVAGIIIIIIGVFPGLFGDKVYRSLIGVDWRKKEWEGILRLIGFSIFGLIIYVLVAESLHLPAPAHIFPETYTHASASTINLTLLCLSYLGHVAGGFIAGLLAAGAARILSRFSSSSAYPSAWDEFIRAYSPRRWVVVGLNNGEVYAGKIKIADVSAGREERDLVLEEPALYNVDSRNYQATAYQYIFIKATELYSIAAVSNPEDIRVVEIGKALFNEGEKEHDN